jgi:ABC-type sugar transport system ATPase subunit
MLDVSLHAVSARILRDVTLTFPKSTCTAIVGPPACGASTLLRVIAGDVTPQSGEVRIGARVVTDLKRSKRPLLFATSSPDAPDRWSVEHLLIAAVRTRTLDREDRHHELQLAVDKWRLGDLLRRTLGTLSSTERTLANLARIELLRPGIALLDRLFEHASRAGLDSLVDDFHRTLRVAGTTVITAPSSSYELGVCDRIVVLDRGTVVQEGLPSQIYVQPASEAAALATGEVNVIPITIRGNVAESVIGAWTIEAPPFEGSGIALIRPEAFTVAARGEDSDLIFGVEEASFRDGRWHARGVLTGGLILRVVLPAGTEIHKGRLLPLRYDPRAVRALQPRPGRGNSSQTDAVQTAQAPGHRR